MRSNFLLRDKLERGGAGRRGHDLMPFAHQPALEHVAIGCIVVDN